MMKQVNLFYKQNSLKFQSGIYLITIQQTFKEVTRTIIILTDKRNK